MKSATMNITRSKSLILFTAIAIAVLSFISCEDQIWDDNIGLFQKSAKLEASADSITISTKETGWWINNVTINDNFITSIQSIDTTSDQFEAISNDVTITRLGPRQLKINLSQNQTTEDRILKIYFQNGNYFDAFTITQAKP